MTLPEVGGDPTSSRSYARKDRILAGLIICVYFGFNIFNVYSYMCAHAFA